MADVREVLERLEQASLFANILDKHSLYDHIKDGYLKEAYQQAVEPTQDDPVSDQPIAG